MDVFIKNGQIKIDKVGQIDRAMCRILDFLSHLHFCVLSWLGILEWQVAKLLILIFME
jgi:hypothetical protein